MQLINGILSLVAPFAMRGKGCGTEQSKKSRLAREEVGRAQPNFAMDDSNHFLFTLGTYLYLVQYITVQSRTARHYLRVRDS